MSKSLGNFVVVRDALTRWRGEEIRWLLLSAHYRQPLDWTEAGLQQARSNLDRVYTALRRSGATSTSTTPDSGLERVRSALCDDFNTPLAFTELMALVGRLNRAEGPSERDGLVAAIRAAGALLGVAGDSAESWFQTGSNELAAEEIDALIAKRKAARADKDFATSDQIRDALLDQGVVLEDGADGTTWRYQADS